MAHLPFAHHFQALHCGSHHRGSLCHAALHCGALLLLCISANGCTASSQSEADAPAPSSESSTKETPIEDEVPNVKKCHTDTQSCDLTEPLQPGLGCFCPGADGAQEAGTAGS